jgi:lipoprotein-anchoring transpeptidase ErfK/SrfK
MKSASLLALILFAVGACGGEEPDPPMADVLWSPSDTLTDAEIEAGRQDEAWRDAPSVIGVPARELGLDTIAVPERWGEISELPGAGEGVEAIQVTVAGTAAGPSVLYIQILLDRARFSPGVLDGRWGKNTEKAVFWFQERDGLPATGVVDSTTLAKLFDRASRPASYVREHVLVEDDLAGPFVDVPQDVYRQARLRCLCYQSPSEKLAERFHSAPALLAELNPGVDLDRLTPGDPIRVPDLEPAAGSGPDIARIIVSGLGSYLHALDSEGRVLYHFPITLGSGYDPSPLGELEVVSIHADPWFFYQPRLLAGHDPSEPSTRLPPGPNNLVGDTWIKLSEPHYGIHGTREPQTIGYATSSGCVRLTNWDAVFLRERIQPGLAVEFRDTRPATENDERADRAG